MTTNHDVAMCLKVLLCTLCSVALVVRADTVANPSERSLAEKSVSQAGEHRLQLYVDSTTPGTVRLRVAPDREDKPSGERDFIAIPYDDGSTVEGALWSSPSGAAVCVVSGMRSKGGVFKYEMRLFSYNAASKTMTSFDSHRRSVGVAGTDHITNVAHLPRPFDIRLLLRGQLEESSPARSKNLPIITVRDIEQIHVEESTDKSFFVCGLLNIEWSFRLPIAVDEGLQKVSVGTVEVTPVPRD